MESSGEGSVWSGMQADTEASVRASGVWESTCPQSWTESGPGRGKAVNLARLRNWRKADMESPSYSPCHQRGRRPAAKSPLTFLHIYCENRETITLFFYIAFLAYHCVLWDKTVMAGTKDQEKAWGLWGHITQGPSLGQRQLLGQTVGPRPTGALHCPAVQRVVLKATNGHEWLRALPSSVSFKSINCISGSAMVTCC